MRKIAENVENQIVEMTNNDASPREMAKATEPLVHLRRQDRAQDYLLPGTGRSRYGTPHDSQA